MRFEQMIAYIREKPGVNFAKRKDWDWACITWCDDLGFYRGDSPHVLVNHVNLQDLVADDWEPCAMFGKPL